MSPNEAAIVFNSKLNHLYSHDFGEGRFFQVVVPDSGEEAEIRIAARTILKVTYITAKDDIEGLEITKHVNGQQKQSLRLSKFNLEQLRRFLDFINSIDLKGISERRIRLADDSLTALDDETKRKIVTLLSSETGGDVVQELLRQGHITSRDLVNTGYRKQQLDVFRKLLYENYLPTYKNEHCKPETKDEVAWQHFFRTNEWMFGYGLDYRFNGILQKEFHASDTTAAGKGAVISDFLLGDKRFTTFVELKLPSTPLFGATRNRSGSWRLSTELFEAYSQILEQKASGQIKVETTKELLDDFNRPIHQRAYDSRTILIIGSWDEVGDDEQGVKTTKTRTFELFRRDSRNIDIVTYDELYERATYIVESNVPGEGRDKDQGETNYSPLGEHEVPF
jgi:hypothetical protein